VGTSGHLRRRVRPGSVGTFEWVGHRDFPVRIDVVEPETSFGLTWASGRQFTEEDASQIRFELVEDGGDTLVTVTESGFDAVSDLAERRVAMEGNVTGWNTVLDALADYAEGARAPVSGTTTSEEHSGVDPSGAHPSVVGQPS
jgi:uncharacterized protein YndB with AHSA1/START domain